MATRLTVTQTYDAPPAGVFALFGDRAFIEGRVERSGGIDPQVVSVDSTPDGLTIVTRQGIPASALPSMVSSMMKDDPVTERTEQWRADGDSYVADFSVSVKGAPASLKGSMTLRPAGAGSQLDVVGDAVVPIPIFGGKIEQVIAEQVRELLEDEQVYTRERLAS